VVASTVAIAKAILGPAALAAARTLSLASSNTPLQADSQSVGRPGTANPPHAAFPGAPDKEKTLYLIVLAALLALLAFTIWREFRALRPGMYWRH
jgi:hypothetical protein